LSQRLKRIPRLGGAALDFPLAPVRSIEGFGWAFGAALFVGTMALDSTFAGFRAAAAL
jgi:hypothetical protein